MKKRLIAIDDGHGMETPGKRTPILPNGTFMRENEFNRRVADLLAEHLKRCGFDVLLVAAGDTDVPLKIRTQRANAAGADLYISIHANAVGSGGFNNTGGIETLYKPGRPENERLATILQRRLVGGTKLPNRGLKQRTDLYVLNTATMPAALVECAFMTRLEEAVMLQSEAYRQECALELALGVCEYFGVAFVMEKAEVIEPTGKKGEEEMELTSYQRDMLVKGLQALLDQKVINDPSWVKKAKEGTLTLSELTWLNFILIANR